ncbi:MAG TPA: diaminopimelate epimerase [Trebonia sp.]|nr:diaminopimelate epimerase [Trebonia sp.]
MATADTVSLTALALEADYDRLRAHPTLGPLAERLAFSVMHGNGNMILVVDEALSGLSASDIGPVLARDLCEAFLAVRVDGVSFVRTGAGPLRMTYFDRDGTNATMCGNGLRCVTQYGTERGYLRSDADTVMTDDGPKWVSAADGRIRVSLGMAREFQRAGTHWYFVFTGVAHLVVLLEGGQELEGIDVPTVGAALRYDEQLCRRLNHPEGLHVDFVQRDGKGIRIRTYEVGVEDETRACGTGAAASAYVASRVWGLPYPLPVTVRGGLMQVEETTDGLLISGVTAHLFGNLNRGPINGSTSGHG